MKKKVLLQLDSVDILSFGTPSQNLDVTGSFVKEP